MSIFSKFKKLSGADRVLDARNKITAAVEAEKGKLLQVIPERFAAESALREAEAANALSEPVDIEGARRRVSAAMASIEQHSTVIAGLRHRLAEQAGEIDAQYKAVRLALPDHVERVKGDFAAEWTKGIAAFGALLGKRVAIEALVGKLTLPDPRPEALELHAEISAPWKAAEDLNASLEDIAGFGRAAMMPTVDAMSPGVHRAYEKTAVYRVSHPASGMEPGTLVTDAIFAPGMLEHLHNISYYCEGGHGLQDWKSGIEAADRAVRRVTAEREQEERQAIADRDKPWLVQYDQATLDASAEAGKRINNSEVPTPVSSGPTRSSHKPWGEGPQHKVTGG